MSIIPRPIQIGWSLYKKIPQPFQMMIASYVASQTVKTTAYLYQHVMKGGEDSNVKLASELPSFKNMEVLASLKGWDLPKALLPRNVYYMRPKTVPANTGTEPLKKTKFTLCSDELATAVGIATASAIGIASLAQCAQGIDPEMDNLSALSTCSSHLGSELLSPLALGWTTAAIFTHRVVIPRFTRSTINYFELQTPSWKPYRNLFTTYHFNGLSTTISTQENLLKKALKSIKKREQESKESEKAAVPKKHSEEKKTYVEEPKSEEKSENELSVPSKEKTKPLKETPKETKKEKKLSLAEAQERIEKFYKTLEKVQQNLPLINWALIHQCGLSKHNVATKSLEKTLKKVLDERKKLLEKEAEAEKKAKTEAEA